MSEKQDQDWRKKWKQETEKSEKALKIITFGLVAVGTIAAIFGISKALQSNDSDSTLDNSNDRVDAQTTEKKSRSQENPMWDHDSEYKEMHAWIDSRPSSYRPENNYYNPDNRYLGLGPNNAYSPEIDWRRSKEAALDRNTKSEV